MRRHRDRSSHPILAAALLVIAGGMGLLTAIVLNLNLHVMVGFDRGYQASPREVLEFSSLLLVADVVLLVALPTGAVLAARWLLRAVERAVGP